MTNENTKKLNRFTINSIVDYDGVEYVVVDFRFVKDEDRYVYDLYERNGDGAMLDTPEDKLKDPTAADGADTGKDLFVVAWADLDPNENILDSGTLNGDLFPTFADARAAVDEQIDEIVREDMETFDEKDYEEVYGTTDKAEIRKKFITTDNGDFVYVVNPNTAFETQYSITKCSLKYIG